jgi:hypothetical protein
VRRESGIWLQVVERRDEGMREAEKRVDLLPLLKDLMVGKEDMFMRCRLNSSSTVRILMHQFIYRHSANHA